MNKEIILEITNTITKYTVRIASYICVTETKMKVTNKAVPLFLLLTKT